MEFCHDSNLYQGFEWTRNFCNTLAKSLVLSTLRFSSVHLQSVAKKKLHCIAGMIDSLNWIRKKIGKSEAYRDFLRSSRSRAVSFLFLFLCLFRYKKGKKTACKWRVRTTRRVLRGSFKTRPRVFNLFAVYLYFSLYGLFYLTLLSLLIFFPHLFSIFFFSSFRLRLLVSFRSVGFRCSFPRSWP